MFYNEDIVSDDGDGSFAQLQALILRLFGALPSYTDFMALVGLDY